MAEKILVVDDDLDSLKLIGMMLQRQGYEVVAASTGGQALVRAAAELPNLIILDVMMPDMDGYEVTRRLRGKPETRAIPIIMFTAKTLIDDKVAGFEAGVDDYLTKPTHPAELSARVKHMLERAPRRQTPESQQGTGIGVIGAKGGIGTTTVAINLAAALAQNGSKPLLADIRPGSGSMGLMLGIEKIGGMSSVLMRPAADMRPADMEKDLLTHASGVRILPSSVRPKEAQIPFTAESAEAAVRALKTLGNPAIFDLGCTYSALTSRLLLQMDRILLTVEPDPITLKMGLGLLRELDNEIKKPVQIVVMTGIHSRTQMPWHEVEHLLGREILAIISAAPELAARAVQTGTPMVLLQPNDIAASQLTKLAADLKV